MYFLIYKSVFGAQLFNIIKNAMQESWKIDWKEWALENALNCSFKP